MFDSRVWLDFCSDTYANFLCNPFLLLFVYECGLVTHAEYFLGAIYMTVQNLPRNLCYRQKNVILIGIIPGPSEPPISLNSYLTPLVEVLKIGWLSGFTIHDKHSNPLKARVALSCVACDIPASRKVCGFLSHNVQKVTINV